MELKNSMLMKELFRDLCLFVWLLLDSGSLNTERAHKRSAVCTLFASFAPIVGSLRPIYTVRLSLRQAYDMNCFV